MDKFEQATRFQQRCGMGLSPEDTAALTALDDAATKCAECGWQRADTLSRHRLLCGTCARVEQISRSFEATAARLRRMQTRG